MTETNDGFVIAEEDLKLRGPGDIDGTQQSGIPFKLKIADLGKDGQILSLARDIAKEVLAEDPLLTAPKNTILKTRLEQLNRNNQTGWFMIS